MPKSARVFSQCLRRRNRMFNETHDLASELPEHRETIHRLKQSDAHFARLFKEYHEVDRSLHRIEQELETPSDQHVEAMKKQRLALKDELHGIILAAEKAA